MRKNERNRYEMTIDVACMLTHTHVISRQEFERAVEYMESKADKGHDLPIFGGDWKVDRHVVDTPCYYSEIYVFTVYTVKITYRHHHYK